MREIKFRALDALDCRWVYYGTAINGTVDHLQLRKETESQYTGLKDKNGVEIYEGDIVKNRKQSRKQWVGDVQYICDGFRIMNHYCEPRLSNVCYVEVIGNIYENPELLG